MALQCFNCQKGRMVGKQHKHHKGVAGKRWLKRAPATQKIFKPNLHSARVSINGGFKRVKLCTKCLRIVKKEMEEKKVKNTKPQEESTATVTL